MSFAPSGKQLVVGSGSLLDHDADDSGKGKAVEIASLSKNLKMTDKDFFMV